MKLKVSMDCCDGIIVAKIKKDIKAVKGILKSNLNPLDQSTVKDDLAALRRVLEYYGG